VGEVRGGQGPPQEQAAECYSQGKSVSVEAIGRLRLARPARCRPRRGQYTHGAGALSTEPGRAPRSPVARRPDATGAGGPKRTPRPRGFGSMGYAVFGFEGSSVVGMRFSIFYFAISLSVFGFRSLFCFRGNCCVTAVIPRHRARQT
jgi:hypothetical protein